MAYFKRIIPSLLLSDGRLVKGVKFKNHQDAGNPASTIRMFNDQMADEIIVCDIDATKRRVGPDLATLNAFASRCFVPICFGGGIKNLEMAKKVILNGADKVLVNSHAIENPTLISEISDAFGSQAVVVAVDFVKTRAGHRVAKQNAQIVTSLNPIEWCKEVQKLGAGELVLTSVDQEGTRNGIEQNIIEEVSKVVELPIIVQGGIGSLDDCVEVLKLSGVSGIAMGRMLQFSDANLIKIRRHVLQCGLQLRR